MSNPYVGEIRIFGFNFAPLGWATCDGQLLAISQNTALFSILGTNYGGNGTTTFALPNFQGDTGVQQGQGAGLSQYFVGQQSGTITSSIPKRAATARKVCMLRRARRTWALQIPIASITARLLRHWPWRLKRSARAGRARRTTICNPMRCCFSASRWWASTRRAVSRNAW
jgi:hypothetical protein